MQAAQIMEKRNIRRNESPINQDQMLKNKDTETLEGLRRWSFRHRCLPNEKAAILMKKELEENSVSPFYIRLILDYPNKCRKDFTLPHEAISCISRARIKNENEREDLLEEKLKSTIATTRRVVERSRKIIQDFEKPRQIKNIPMLQEIYQESISGIPDFFREMEGGVFQLKPTFNCDKKYSCQEILLMCQSQKLIQIEFLVPSRQNGIQVRELNEGETSNLQYQGLVCNDALVDNATTRRVEIHGTFRGRGTWKDKNFIIVIINDGCLFGPMNLCGIYRKQMDSVDQYLTWKICFT